MGLYNLSLSLSFSFGPKARKSDLESQDLFFARRAGSLLFFKCGDMVIPEEKITGIVEDLTIDNKLLYYNSGVLHYGYV